MVSARPGPGLALWGVLLLTGTLWSGVVHADQNSTPEAVSISATVVGSSIPPANPVVEFHGLAAQSASVTVTRAGATVATQTASAQAAFHITLPSEPTGQGSYTIHAVDADGRDLAPLTFALNLVAGTNTSITGIFLGPSIAVDRAAVVLGQFVTLSGATAPASAVTVTTASQNATVTAAADGRWTTVVDTTTLGVGTHAASAQAATGGGQVSTVSATVTITVSPTTVVSPIDPCEGKKPADFNCKGGVNIADFSVLLFFWQERNPSNPRLDLNGDGIVDVVDFSIFLFQWSG